MTKQNDSLFLLEVLIDKIVFVKSPCFSDKDFKTCVNIECAGVEPLEICDDEPGACIAKGNGPFIKSFNNGKSCLFSLSENQIASAMTKYPINVSVYKSLPCGCLPTKIIMGECTIDMTKEFVEARKTFLEDPSNVSYQALKDSFRIVGPDGSETGDIIMFLRISCFGKLIITRFQGPGGPPNIGAGKGSGAVDRSCMPKKDFQSMQDPCACGAARTFSRAGGNSAGPPCNVGGGSGVCPPARDPYNSMPCEDPDDPCFCSGPKSVPHQQMICRNTDQYCLHVPKVHNHKMILDRHCNVWLYLHCPFYWPGRNKQFEEIGTTLGGNELKIKVPVSASIIKKISQTHCAMQCPFPKQTEDGPCDLPCGKNQISLSIPSEAICCNNNRPAATQFSCTTEGCLQTSKHGQQVALARGDHKQPELINLDVFVLKVAKTATLNERKCKLELELVTPKGPDKKAPVKKLNTCLQSDLDCECLVQRLKKSKSKRNKHCCPPGNKIIFQLPTDTCDMNHKQRTHFNFTTEGIGDLTRDEPAQLVPPTSKNYSGVTYDFSKQVIKLKIGKTVEMPGRKSKFEYQFITPSITHERVVPVREARTAQCLPTCSDHCPLNSIYPPLVVGNAPKELYYEKILEDTMKVVNNKKNMKNTPRILCSVKFNKTPTKILKNLGYQSSVSSYSASNSIFSQLSKKSTSSLNKVHFARESYTSIVNLKNMNIGLFGKVEIPVYMTLPEKLSGHQTSGTQATASINKCLQVCDNWANLDLDMTSINSQYSSTCTESTLTYRYFGNHNTPENLLNQKVYFFGRKKEEKLKGMGLTSSNTKLQKTSQSTSTSRRNDVNKINSKSSVHSSSSTKVKNPNSNVKVSKPNPNVPARTSKGALASGTSKSVTIKDDKERKPCPALGISKGDMMVTISHIKIGPKETCPVHGSEPCQGPKCILASSGEEQGPVKVSTANNPRRGVFEIVIRKLTGAPLATNELMLEWTPPPSPSRSPPCNTICPTPYIYPGTCRHSKCKLIVCRPSSPCRSNCCKKLPCAQPPCRSIPCQKFCKSICYESLCRPFKSCSTNPQKSPCSVPLSCNPPCARPQCTVSCKSSPCLRLRPCPIGRKRVKKSRSQPKIKSHRKRISPCHNRSKACPVVRCRSVPGPCLSCCKVRPVCLPRKCCSVLPCRLPKICVSSCSSSCG